MRRRLSTAIVTLVGTATLWAALLINAVVTIGHEYNYLQGGSHPFSPDTPVTYWSLAMSASPAISIFFILCAFGAYAGYGRRAWHWLSFLWLFSAIMGGTIIAREFRIDFGMSWGTGEALSELFFRGYLTPFLWFIGLMIFVMTIQRVLRPKRERRPRA